MTQPDRRLLGGVRSVPSRGKTRPNPFITPLEQCSLDQRYGSTEIMSTEYLYKNVEAPPPPYSTGNNDSAIVSSYRGLSKRKKMGGQVNVRNIGIGLFVAASIFCLYKIWAISKLRIIRPNQLKDELKMVNIFYRHGDRSPGDPLVDNDLHRQYYAHLWPEGMGELTDLGKYRQYRIGLETRRSYDGYLGYNSSEISAFSSSRARCVQSMQLILQGLYMNQRPKSEQRDILTRMRPPQCGGPKGKQSRKVEQEEASCSLELPSGTGFGDEWKRAKIDVETIPTLNYNFLNNCKFRLENPSPVDSNLSNSKAIRSLIGIGQLRDTLLERYKKDLDFDTLGLWSGISCELNLVLTNWSVALKSHFADWIGQVVSTRSKSLLTLYDILEQATLLGYRDRLEGDAELVQAGTLLSSVVESQLSALGLEESDTTIQSSRLWPVSKYRGKKMFLYSSHDSIMQRLLFSLALIQSDPDDFESRHAKWFKSNDDLAKFLAGLKMSSYGMSYRIELRELTLKDEQGDDNQSGDADYDKKKRKEHLDKALLLSSSSADEDTRRAARRVGRSFAYVQMSLYNREDARFQEVDYKLVDLGTACMRLFRDKYGREELDRRLSRFYDSELAGSLDKRRICPFDLWLNVTSSLRLDRHRLDQLCPAKQTEHHQRQ